MDKRLEDKIDEKALSMAKDFWTDRIKREMSEKVQERYENIVLTLLAGEIITEEPNIFCAIGIHKFVRTHFQDWEICKRCGKRREVYIGTYG